MEQKELYEFIRKMNPNDYATVKEMIAREERNRYDEMWWTHDRIDNYLYVVHYEDGHTHITCKGAVSYLEYVKNDDAVWIERYTKDLFPTHEFLMRKEKA